MRARCLGLCERAPASYRTIAGAEPQELQLPAEGPPLPQAGEPSLRLLRRIGAGVDPIRSTPTSPPAASPRSRRARELGAEAVIRRGEGVAPARPRRRRVPDRRQVGGGREAARAAALRRLQRRRVGARHVQGPRADGERPVRARRGDHDRRLRDRRGQGVRLRARRVPARARAHRERDRAELARHLDGFEIELRIGAGAYICGEETALFQSIEGYRGEPRNKPPFPVEVGLFGKPTAVNNVETLFNVLEILREGGAAYAQTGTEGSTGTRLFCVSGCVERPGLYELPFGATLRELLDARGSGAAARPCCSAARRAPSSGPTCST